MVNSLEKVVVDWGMVVTLADDGRNPCARARVHLGFWVVERLGKKTEPRVQACENVGLTRSNRRM